MGSKKKAKKAASKNKQQAKARTKTKAGTRSKKARPKKTGKEKARPKTRAKPKSKVSVSSSRLRLPKPKRPLKIIRTIRDMKKFAREMRSRRRSIALVPTMGFLHDGHVSLIREARRRASVVVVSVFVNPAQFLPNEDLDRYPRDFSGDRRKVHYAGADVLFAPETVEMYPEGSQTFVEVTDVTRDYCGAARPGHFRGVATVVTKLFNVVQPQVAIFGEKDFQQVITIRQMVRDLNLEVEIVGMPTVRDDDGLAMSSRNTYLNPAQRQQATAIYRGLKKAKRLCDTGERDSSELTAAVLDLLREEPELQVEYVAVCDPTTLERIPEVSREAVLLVGARVGNTRLIDNIRLGSRSRR